MVRTAEHELDALLARIGELRVEGFGLQVARREAPGDGWQAANDLTALDEQIAAAARGAGTELRTVGAEWLLEQWAWQAASLLAGAMLAGSRVPDLAPANVLLGVEAGLPWGIALRGGELARPAGEAELARAAQAAYAGFLDPLVDALGARRLRPRRALWRAAGDRVGQAFHWCAAAFGEPERAARLAMLMLEPPAPFHVPLQLGRGPDGVPHHARASCCLSHRTADAIVCPACPLARPRRHR